MRVAVSEEISRTEPVAVSVSTSDGIPMEGLVKHARMKDILSRIISIYFMWLYTYSVARYGEGVSNLRCEYGLFEATA